MKSFEGQIPSKTIAVAVSGGVDSLYTLIRLKEAGLEVIAVHGIFAQRLGLYGEDEIKAHAAVLSGLEEACAKLGIPLHVCDCSQSFMEEVITPFVRSYAAGLTPNPCALCNAAIKFGRLKKQAFALGAAAVATGHYVRCINRAGDDLPPSALRAPVEDEILEAVRALDAEQRLGPILLQGADPVKDQSYFLALVPVDELRDVLFPLGGSVKQEAVLAMARYGLAVPQPKESQEVCFIPDDEYRDFLPKMAERLGVELSGPGPAMLADGRKVGIHNGLWQYTQGQRRGLGIGWKEPLYVLAKEKEENVLRLGPKSDMGVDGCFCASANILLPEKFWPEIVFVKTRYREQPRRARVQVAASAAGTALSISFPDAEKSIAPGQIAAVYIPLENCREADGGPVLRLVAGGVISGMLGERN